MKNNLFLPAIVLGMNFLSSCDSLAGFIYKAKHSPVPCEYSSVKKTCKKNSVSSEPFSPSPIKNKNIKDEHMRKKVLQEAEIRRLPLGSAVKDPLIAPKRVKEISLSPQSQNMIPENVPLSSERIRTLSLDPSLQVALPQWQAIKGATLRQVLEQWTRQASVDLEWGTEFDYPLLTSFRAEGAFEDALKKLLDAFSESTPRPYGRLHRNGGHSVLVIQTRGKTHYDQ